MNWRLLRPWPWLDTRAGFVARAPRGGRLLDLGASDGETLRHIAELRPDLPAFVPQWVEWMFSRRVEDRPASAAAALDAFEKQTRS